MFCLVKEFMISFLLVWVGTGVIINGLVTWNKRCDQLWAAFFWVAVAFASYVAYKNCGV